MIWGGESKAKVAISSIYARRWGVEVTIKELKSGLHLGQMQVTKEAERVTRSVALSVMAYSSAWSGCMGVTRR